MKTPKNITLIITNDDNTKTVYENDEAMKIINHYSEYLLVNSIKKILI